MSWTLRDGEETQTYMLRIELVIIVAEISLILLYPTVGINARKTCYPGPA
jgi:hypothetical protein